MEPGGRRRPGLYATIPVSVLQVPAGEEKGPRGLPNLVNQEEKRRMRRRRRRMMMRRRCRGRGGMRRICRTVWWRRRV